MSDIFREVEEDVRRDRLEKLWKAYGTYVIALVALMLVGVAAFELWQRYEAAQRDKESAAFVAAQHLTNPNQAASNFAALSKSDHGGYGLLARLEQANVMGSGQRPEAIALYKAIANDDHGTIGSVARLRAGWLMVDTNAPRADLQTLLQPVMDPGSVWRQMAEEILAYSDYRAGNILAADAAFTKIAADPDSPDALRNRAHTIAAFLSGGGGANYGTVPPPAPPPAMPAAPSPTVSTAGAAGAAAP